MKHNQEMMNILGKVLKKALNGVGYCYHNVICIGLNYFTYALNLSPIYS